MWRKQTGQKHINSREHICLKCGYKQDRSGKQDCRDRLGSVGGDVRVRARSAASSPPSSTFRVS